MKRFGIFCKHFMLGQLLRATVEDIAIGSGGLGFDSQTGQIGHSIANGFATAAMFFSERVAQAISRGDGSRLLLRPSTLRV